MNFFALVLTHHRKWGLILMPYIIADESNKKYFEMIECLSPNPDTNTLATLSPEEREVTRILNDISDRSLFKLFSKDGSVKEFLEKVTDEKIEKIIRPHIERKLFKCFTIARDEGIQIYLQKEKMSNFHPEDHLTLYGEVAKPIFRFDRYEDHCTYSLSLDAGGSVIDLLNSGCDIICMSPCILLRNKNLIFVSDVDGSKLRPFFTKRSIIIPKNTEIKYFGGFVRIVVNNYKVTGTGFEIIESNADKDAYLYLEQGIRGFAVLILKFRYAENFIYPTETATSFTSFHNDNGKFIYKKTSRDFEWEKSRIDLLGECGFFSEDEVNFTSGNSRTDKEDLFSLIEAVNKNYNDLTDSGFVIVSGSLDSPYSIKPVSIEINHQVTGDWFDLKAIVIIGKWRIPFIRFRRNILEEIREYRLPDGEIAILPQTWFAKYRNIFEFGKSSGETLRIHKQHFSLLHDTFGEDERGISESIEKLLIPEHAPLISQPAGFTGKMRHYQIDGLSWMNYLQSTGMGGCLADDMGLGKTIQALALLQYNKENLKQENKKIRPEMPVLFQIAPETPTSLIVVPATLIYNWGNEIKKYVPDMKVCFYKGSQRNRSTDYFDYYDIILSSYHTIRQDIDVISSYKFHYIILDESQVIKNPASMLYKTMTKLKSDYKLVLTGTPVENSLTDLWTQLSFVNPGLLGNLSFFRREYVRPIEKNEANDKEIRLKKIIKPFILRRTKEMVANDLPPVTEQTVFCDMTEEQSKLYDTEKSAIRNTILKNLESRVSDKSAIIILQGLMKLRQIANHPVMTFEDYSAGSGKFDMVLGDIQSVVSEGHKLLIFSSFVKHLDLYAEAFRKERTKFSFLTGASTDRGKIVNSFQNDPSNRIFLISVKAGGLGLNLTSADYVFILDPWWNPAVEMQALNRAHRIGQGKNVFVYRYISSESIEEKIIRLQEKKSRLADTFIRSNNPLKEIGVSQILEILD